MTLNALVPRRIVIPVGLVSALIISGLLAALAPVPIQSLQIMIVVMLAAMISSIVGFAFSAIAGSLLYFLIPSPVEAVKIMICCSIAIQIYSVIKIWKNIDWVKVTPFLWGGALTVVPFSWLVLNIGYKKFIVIIAFVLMAFGLFSFFHKQVAVNVNEKYRRCLDIIAGAIGGITAPIAALPGPAVMIWCSMQGWDKITQRAVFQPFILIIQVATLVSLSAVGGNGASLGINIYYALAALVGCHIGLRLFDQITNKHFNYMVYFLLMVSGFAMLMKVV